MEIKTGRLIRWRDDKGFGFIKPDDAGKDIFIHITALKGMARKPVVGDVIHYQLEFDINGKCRAINAVIGGAPKKYTLEPLAKRPKLASATIEPGKSRRFRQPNSSRRLGRLGTLAILTAVLGTVHWVEKIRGRQPVVSNTELENTNQPEPIQQFHCQGKVYCSQMTSAEEADFYLHNCPGTKMDGDHDGVPCEQQFH